MKLRKHIRALMLVAIAATIGSALLISSDHTVAAKASVQAAPKKRALLIGINNYCRIPGSLECAPTNYNGKYWWDLHTEDEVEMLARTLRTHFKFDEVTVLKTNAETTHQSIVDHFRKLLIEPTHKGDIVYFHFSGHGEQVPDDGDPGDIEPDGMDETIIPSDYVSRDDPAKNIRDDEIGKLLDELAAKEPGNVTISLDSCYSGTATRGGNEVLVPRGQGWHGPMPSRGATGDDDVGSGLTRGGEVPKNYVFLAAASPRQVANEALGETLDKTGKTIHVMMGAFTVALVEALNQASDTTTYRDIFYQINARVTSGTQGRQVPQIEGRMDTTVMNGAAAHVDPFILVGNGNNGSLTLKAGRLQGMTAGSKFFLCPAGTLTRKDCTGPVSEATIDQIYQTESTLRLKDAKKIVVDPAKPLRAFETEHAFDFSALKVTVADLSTIEGGKDAANAIKGFVLADATSKRGSVDYDVLVRPAEERDKQLEQLPAEFKGVLLQRPDGTVFAKVPAGPELGKTIQEALKNVIRWKTVSNMTPANTDIKVEARMYLTDGSVDTNGVFRETPTGTALVEAARKNGGDNNLNFDLDKYVWLEVKNPNTYSVYVTVLDLQPNGVIAAAFPNYESGFPTNNEIAAGDTLRLPFHLTPPVGAEMFKILITRENTDFSPLVTPALASRGGDTEGIRGGKAHPLGQIFDALSDPEKRGAKLRGVTPVKTDPENWTSQTITFTVRKK